MSEQDQVRWNEKYRESRHRGEVSAWIESVVKRIAPTGDALDLACGEGVHAILFARLGWKVTAVDISRVGLELAKRAAQGLDIEWIEADLDVFVPRQKFHLVVISRFFDRVRLPQVVEMGLAPGGWLIAETYHEQSASLPGARVTNPEYLVQRGGWRRLFPFVDNVEEEEDERMSRFVGRRKL